MSRPPCTGIVYRYLVHHPTVRPVAYLSIAVVRTDLVRHSAVSVFDVGMRKVTVVNTVRVAANVLVR